MKEDIKMDKLPSQKELLEAHRTQLDAKFRAKFPNGRFCLQYRNDALATHYGEPYYLIHWEYKRPTSHDRFRGISVCRRANNLEIEHNPFRNNSFGKCNNYDTLEKLFTACERRNVPAELVNAFEKDYLAGHKDIIERYK
jgi:hypothetical protein